MLVKNWKNDFVQTKTVINAWNSQLVNINTMLTIILSCCRIWTHARQDTMSSSDPPPLMLSELAKVGGWNLSRLCTRFVPRCFGGTWCTGWEGNSWFTHNCLRKEVGWIKSAYLITETETGLQWFVQSLQRKSSKNVWCN